MNILIDITRDLAMPALARQRSLLLNRGDLNRAAAEGALPLFQNNFQRMAATQQNVLKHTGFWNRMLAATRADSTDEAGIISMPREVAQRYFGGTITPKSGKFLSIPARTEAVGVSPRQMDNLVFVVLGDAGPALVLKSDTHRAKQAGKNKGQLTPVTGAETATHGEGAVMYWLRASVDQEGDESVLPADGDIAAAAIHGVETYLKLNDPSRTGGGVN